ncbi:MAG TPA: choice-of-anchor R domain-containing protein [Bryobacteraceae bacterium]|nr:choice-of-anchor R domain-containing protein [Bryobacteraceae bacterium]
MPLKFTTMARFAVLLLMISVAGLDADTIFDNLAYGSGSDDSVASGALAASFSTGASAFSFNDLMISLSDPEISDGGSVDVTLYSDTSTTPGSLLDTLGIILDSSLTTTNSSVDLSGFGTISLASDTRYWIELTAAGTSSAAWQYATPASGGLGTAGEFYYYGGTSYSDADGGFLMSISGTASAVPEPRWGGILLLGIAFLAVKLRPQVARCLSHLISTNQAG